MIKVGPVGGQAGSFWDEKGRDQVAGIFVSYSKDAVESLQFLFYESGNSVLSNKHGVFYHSQNFYAVVFDYPSEFLTSISGYHGKLNQYDPRVLKTIKFSTNKGSYGPFGCTQPSTDTRNFIFLMENRCLFGSFHGSENGSGVESIGIYVKPIMPSLIVTTQNPPRVVV
ncbi:inactive protein restricted tev movement 1, partial [Nicotiana attenuata]